MPQVYRRRSEISHPRPALEPRRRSTPGSSSQQQPTTITDADDSIVLSDLVRTGEASRLRRRGAMRLDHPRTANQPPPPSQPPLPTSGRTLPLPPQRVSTPPWASSDPLQDDDYPYQSQDWRDWSNDDSFDSNTAMPLDDLRTTTTTPSNANTEIPFMLLCGADSNDNHINLFDHPASSPFHPSPLPRSPYSPTPSCSNSNPPQNTHSPFSNGCGAVVHMRAFPQKPRGVWVGKQEATDVVVPLDASYFERTIVAKMMKSACGCIREGIGCAVCGNTLGTRYMPCQAASEGLFSASNPPHHSTHFPRHPSGPRYWATRPRPPCSQVSGSASSSRPNFYVYTFFAANVSSAPTFKIYHSRNTSTTTSSRIPQQAQPERPPRLPENDPAPASPSRPTWYDYTFSAPPVPYSPPSLPQSLPPQMVPSQTPPVPISSFTIPPLPPSLRSSIRTAPRPFPLDTRRPSTSTGRVRDDEEGMVLDADGVLVESEPNSPDKVGNETVVWPGR